MNIVIRKEEEKDFAKVEQVIELAFRALEVSDHKEHLLVARLRQSPAFIPDLSIVAEYQNEVVGHILLTRINIINEYSTFQSLALAPVSVLPKYQKKGIGSLLINAAHKKAKELQFQSIVLLGHEDYYTKFGYEMTSKYGIQLPFEAPEENCLIIALTEEGLQGVNGMVKYAKAFFE